MKLATSVLILPTAAALFAGCSSVGAPPSQTKYVQSPPRVVATTPAPASQSYVYEQQPSSARPVLISPEQAKNVIDRFKAGYPKLGNPRIVLYVNRELVDEQSGLKLTGRTERTQQNTTQVKTENKADPDAPTQNTSTPAIQNPSNVTIVGDVRGLQNRYPGSSAVDTKTEKTTSENTYKQIDKNYGTLADKQTVRDVERLFGRPLRMAGANLTDQKIATQLLAGKPLEKLALAEGEQARKDREALSKIADVALEVLISSRPITVTEVSGEKTYNVPDIQATAIRLNDARVLGQATASDIIGKDRYAGNIVRNFDVREIAEATALALMEDMLMNAPE